MLTVFVFTSAVKDFYYSARSKCLANSFHTRTCNYSFFKALYLSLSYLCKAATTSVSWVNTSNYGVLYDSTATSFFTKLATNMSTTSEIELSGRLLVMFWAVKSALCPSMASSSDRCVSPFSRLLTSFTSLSSSLSTVSFGRSESLKSGFPLSNPAASPLRRYSLFSWRALRLRRCLASERAFNCFALRSIVRWL